MKFKNFSTTKKLLIVMCFLIIPLTIIDVINTYLMLKPELTRPIPEGLLILDTPWQMLGREC